MPYELLEEVRLLSNVEMPNMKLLNVVLAGQPELSERLNEVSLRQLKQRISLRCELSSMNVKETAAYIAGRIRIAGGRPEQLFTRESIGAVYAASQGLPRTVNVICDNALLGGYAAQVQPITAAFVEDVCRDFDINGSADPEPAVAVADDQDPVATPMLPAPAAEVPRTPVAPERLFADVAGRKRRFTFF